MADLPINPNGNGPATGPNLSYNQGAARLAPLGSPEARSQPRPERGQPGERLTLPPQAPPEPRPPLDAADPDFPPQQPDDQEQPPEAEEQRPERELAPDTVLWAEADGRAVTLEEARQGYLREDDYRRKTAMAAETRRQLEGGFQELNADREAMAQFILRSVPDLSPDRIVREQLTGEQVWRMQQEGQQLIGYVQQLRQRTVEDQRRLEAQEVEQARSLAPEIIKGWSDPKVMESEITATRQFLDKRGVPATSQAKLARDPWLAMLAVEAAKFSQVRIGADRGRHSQSQRPVTPSLPAQDQTQPLVGSQRDQLTQLARGQGSRRQRHDAGATLLRGVPVRSR